MPQSCTVPARNHANKLTHQPAEQTTYDDACVVLCCVGLDWVAHRPRGTLGRRWASTRTRRATPCSRPSRSTRRHATPSTSVSAADGRPTAFTCIYSKDHARQPQWESSSVRAALALRDGRRGEGRERRQQTQHARRAAPAAGRRHSSHVELLGVTFSLTTGCAAGIRAL